MSTPSAASSVLYVHIGPKAQGAHLKTHPFHSKCTTILYTSKSFKTSAIYEAERLSFQCRNWVLSSLGHQGLSLVGTQSKPLMFYTGKLRLQRPAHYNTSFLMIEPGPHLAPGIRTSNIQAMEFLNIHTWMWIFFINKIQGCIYHQVSASKWVFLAERSRATSWHRVEGPRRVSEPGERGIFAPLFLL